MFFLLFRKSELVGISNKTERNKKNSFSVLSNGISIFTTHSCYRSRLKFTHRNRHQEFIVIPYFYMDPERHYRFSKRYESLLCGRLKTSFFSLCNFFSVDWIHFHKERMTVIKPADVLFRHCYWTVFFSFVFSCFEWKEIRRARRLCAVNSLSVPIFIYNFFFHICCFLSSSLCFFDFERSKMIMIVMHCAPLPHIIEHCILLCVVSLSCSFLFRICCLALLDTIALSIQQVECLWTEFTNTRIVKRTIFGRMIPFLRLLSSSTLSSVSTHICFGRFLRIQFDQRFFVHIHFHSFFLLFFFTSMHVSTPASTQSERYGKYPIYILSFWWCSQDALPFRQLVEPHI